MVPLDGWHLPRHTLDTFPDPKLAYDRRGSYWTFDGDSRRLALPPYHSSVLNTLAKEKDTSLLSSAFAGPLRLREL